MKFAGVLSTVALAGAAAAAKYNPKYPTNYPTTTIAGVEVIDTPIVREARKVIEVFNELQPYLYKHLYRTWLFGAAAINANATLKSELDVEFHAIGSLLHDLGWDLRDNSPYVSEDQRFEVDSGHAAVEIVKDFVKDDKCAAKAWDDIRLERLYDGISLQAELSLITYKNLQSFWIVQSVEFEFPGPRNPLIPEADYNRILAAYPNHYFYRGSNETFTEIAARKPAGTYNTFLQPFGEHYVPGYNASGKILFDLIEEGVANEIASYPNASINN
ncbi:hypothetical protein F4678DRAFT_436269 [Xylaria arbuscula]|nr:hypothetical protein F4678DRAFT_436269 [Xylaria arbuscula]